MGRIGRSWDLIGKELVDPGQDRGAVERRVDAGWDV